jgi:GH15 family glucan-1,4-alpha-glucosidase
MIPGNPWFICSCWYAKYLIRKAASKEEMEEPLEILNWVMDHAQPTGLLAEQVHPISGEGLSVCPLTWSHAEFIDAMTDYVNKLEKL